MKYVIKKIITMLITLFAVSALVFFAFSIIPGNPAVAKLGTEATEESIAKLTAEMGLDRPVMERFGEWILGILKGDFGTSYSYNQSVKSLLAEKIVVTMLLSLLAILITVVLSLSVIFYILRILFLLC